MPSMFETRVAPIPRIGFGEGLGFIVGVLVGVEGTGEEVAVGTVVAVFTGWRPVGVNVCDIAPGSVGVEWVDGPCIWLRPGA